ncbi:MAG: hypothetical protein EGQ09_02450 [Clostridiales bacterium]|nr:hypothetical protein [Clostridiales bacterium]
MNDQRSLPVLYVRQAAFLSGQHSRLVSLFYGIMPPMHCQSGGRAGILSSERILNRMESIYGIRSYL